MPPYHPQYGHTAMAGHGLIGFSQAQTAFGPNFGDRFVQTRWLLVHTPAGCGHQYHPPTMLMLYADMIVSAREARGVQVPADCQAGEQSWRGWFDSVLWVTVGEVGKKAAAVRTRTLPSLPPPLTPHLHCTAYLS